MNAADTSEIRNALGQTRAEWLDHLARIGDDHGYFERIAARHMALFVQEGTTLIVSFDRAERAFGESRNGLPEGFAAVQRRQMSLLSIMASGPTWFRDENVAAFFAGLAREGFFDSFKQVAFVGFGAMCGYAACAYSGAVPGAHVFAASPAATLSTEHAGFDRRFMRSRKLSFSDPFGYAPKALETAGASAILYDPYEATSAAHAAQFTHGNVHRIPLRWLGQDTGLLFKHNDSLVPLLRALLNGRLNATRVLATYRATRRNSPDYLWRLANVAQTQGRFDRAAAIARHAITSTGEARFESLLAQLEPEAAAASA